MIRRAVAFLGALALAAMLFSLAGSVPEGKKLPAAIPLPGEGVPFLFIEARGDSFSSLPPTSLPGESGKAAPVLRGLRSFPFSCESGRYGCAFFPGTGRLLVDGVLRFSGEESEASPGEHSLKAGTPR